MRQQAAALTLRLTIGLLAGIAAWTALDIIDGQVSTFGLALGVGVALGVMGAVGEAQRRRRLWNDGHPVSR